MRRFKTILAVGLVLTLAGWASARGASLHTAPVFLSQPDGHVLACLIANVSAVNIFDIRIEIREVGGNVVASHSQDVLLAQETAPILSINTVDPFIPTPTLRCSFHFRGLKRQVRAAGCLSDSADSFGQLCRASFEAR